MNRELLNMRYLGLGLLGLLSACNSGDVNFPDWNTEWPSGTTGTIQFRHTTFDATEGTVVNVGVTRTGGSAGIVRVDYRTVDGSAEGGSDYTAASGTLTWPSGTSGNQTISIRLLEDDVAEAAESFTIELSNASIAILGLNTSATVNIVDKGTASKFAVGRVESADPACGRLVVMGQKVRTNIDTVFGRGIDPNTYDGLAVGTVVEISGVADSGGTIDAKRIERAAASDRLQLTGDVTALDPARLTFRINQLLLDYSSVALIDLPGGMPAEGMTVTAVGTMSGDTLVVEQLVQAPLAGGVFGE